MTSLTGLSIADGIAVCIGMRVTVSACSSNQPGGLPLARSIIRMRSIWRHIKPFCPTCGAW